MSASKSKQAQLRDLKRRVLTCLHKLSDRDTHSAAASELESIAKTLSADAMPSFISSISATDSSDKSLVSRHCLRLVSVLSDHHGDSLSPYLSKILSSVVRRLRDPNSAVRSACVAAARSISSNLNNPSFASITKPFLESLFTEQDLNAQNGAALCLATIVEGSRNIDVVGLRKLFPRLEKLAKCESFKAKSALVTLIGSVVEVDGVFGNHGNNVIKNLVTCLVEFLSSDDWATRKAAAEALVKLSRVGNSALSEYKASCLKTFEAKRFDKVKAVRETMNQMIEAWKEIPDLSCAVSAPPDSGSSAKEKGSTEHNPAGSRTFMGSRGTRIPLQNPVSGSTSVDNSPAQKSSSCRNESRIRPAMFRKLELKKPSNSNLEISVTGFPGTTISKCNASDKDSKVLEIDEEKQFPKPEIKCVPIGGKNGKQRLGLYKNGRRVVPYDDASAENGDICRNKREYEELSLIRKQLVQIETRQSHLLELLQRFMGSSPNFMQSVEARIHGLEQALDEISFDIAVSSRRMTRNNVAGAMCCKLPGTEYLSLNLWRKRGRLSTSIFHTSPKPFIKTSRYRGEGGRKLIMNPLAETSWGTQCTKEVTSC